MTLKEKTDLITKNLETDKVIKLFLDLGANEVENKENYLVAQTICHNSDASLASKKLYYYKDTHLFMCYTECGGMNIFNFLRHYYEARNISYNWYYDIFKVAEKCSVDNIFTQEDQVSVERKKDRYKYNALIELPEYRDGVLEVFTKYYPVEWLQDGISKETMDKFNILYSVPQNKIIIPHYDINDRLVGIRGRALNLWEIEKGKYMPVEIEGKWYKHRLSLNLYGLNFTKDNIKNYGICYVFEGEKSVLQMDSFDMPNCGVAVCGSNFNKFQLKILMKECQPKEIVLCFDNEELAAKHEYFDKLYNICNKYKNYCNFSFIYDDRNLTNKKDSPTDKGEAIFKELVNRRRRVK